MIYNFKEFCHNLRISDYAQDRRTKDLIEWLKNFYVFNIYEGCPRRIEIIEQIGDYQPLPRKAPKQDELQEKKKKDYEWFTLRALGSEFKPNSKRKVARDAIEDFGNKKYGHTNDKYISQQFVKEPFEKYGESDHHYIWVDYRSYEPLSEEEVNNWRTILENCHIDVEDAANAFYRQEQGEDVSKEKNYYKEALKVFTEKYNMFPVLVSSWRLKKERG